MAAVITHLKKLFATLYEAFGTARPENAKKPYLQAANTAKKRVAGEYAKRAPAGDNKRDTIPGDCREPHFQTLRPLA